MQQDPLTFGPPPPSGWKSSSKALLLGLVALAFLAGGIAAVFMLQDDDPPPSVEQPPGAPQQTPPPPPAKPRPAVVTPPKVDVELSAIDLLKAYNASPSQADTLYKGKVVELTGVVLAAKTDTLGTSFLAMEGGTDRIRGVQCILHTKNVWQLEEVKPDQIVTVRGRCQGVLGDVQLQDCAVMKVRD